MKPSITHPTPMTWFVILTIIAIGLALGLPPDPHAVQQLHTSQVAYRLAVAVLLIPYVIIWYASFYAFAKLQEYTRSIEDAKEGPALNKLTTGMETLAFALVVPTIVSLILGTIAVHHRPFTTASVIIDNYLNLFPGLLAFLLLLNGARALARTARGSLEKVDLRWHGPWFLLLCATFAHLTIENQYRWHPYHLAIWLLVITIIVPYLYGWMVGLLSAYGLHLYVQSVRGVLYKQAFKRLSLGITVTITGSIAIQFANITIAKRVSNSLGAILLIDYGLLVIVAVGLILMALGTKKLKRIEEI